MIILAFFFAAVSGYLVGIMGSSNNPIYQTVADNYYVKNYSKYEIGNEVYANQFQSNDVSFVKLKYPFNATDIISKTSEQQLGYVLKKQATRPYASINSLQYKALTPTMNTTTDTVDYYNGDTGTLNSWSIVDILKFCSGIKLSFHCF